MDRIQYDLDTLVDTICEPGSILWDSETSDLDGEQIIYPSDIAIKNAIKDLVDREKSAGIAQGRREAAAAVRAKRLAGPDGLQMFKSNFNSGIDVAIDASPEGEGVER
jgi:hypothetical protein